MSEAAEPVRYPPKLLVPAGGRARGELRPPSSKSLTQRYFALALLGSLDLRIESPLLAEDTELFLRALETCGMRVGREEGALELRPGAGPAGGEIFCGNGGTMLRFLTAALTALPGPWRLDGVPRLRERPVGALAEALASLGAEIDFEGEPGYPPLAIRGGSLRSGRVRLRAGESSQYLSALLMAGLALPEGLEIEVRSLRSTPYVELTLAAIRELGGRVRREGESRFVVDRGELGSGGRRRVVVEADHSAAAYPAAAAALTGGRVLLRGVEAGSRQGDRAFLDLLGRMGAVVRWRRGRVEIEGGSLEAVEADLSAMPDQVPTLAALAPFAAGTTRILDVPHLRIKESDRLAAMATELGRLGVEVDELPDGLVIPGCWAEGRPPEHGVEVETYGDHRIAMSLALVGLRRPGVTVLRPEVVRKSYPAFWRDLASLVES